VSPQRSNRQPLIDGTLRCLENLPAEKITARAIAEESKANLASIAYHFGSKDDLVTEAVICGLDRWLAEVEAEMGDVERLTPATRFQRANEVIESTRQRHTGLAKNFIGALARAQHNDRLRQRLGEGFHRTRPEVAALLGLGDDEAGDDAAGLVLALFYGLLLQVLLDPTLAIDGDRVGAAHSRLRKVLPDHP
jgi:AcrR family transcriptional regulator